MSGDVETKPCAYCGATIYRSGHRKRPTIWLVRKYCSRECGYKSLSTKYRPELFWSRLRKSGPDGCWVWTGFIGPNGYGTTAVGRRPLATHRAAWILTHGPIPPGMFVCHHCDNKPCCNPKHLFIGTCKDNMRDMAAKGRGRNGSTGQLKVCAQ